MDWADGDMTLVQQCAETVLRVAKQILTDLTPGAATEPDSDELGEPVDHLPAAVGAVRR
jgi:hypothetical protein